MLPDVLKENPHISLFVEALKQTHLIDSLYQYRDPNYDASAYPRYRYVSHVN